jgi:membrane protein DedA with SNARE-associated domain
VQSFILHWGYLAVFLFSVAESACVPIPSEITLGLGGAAASGAVFLNNGHHLSLAFVILIAIAGQLVGSYLAYAVGRTGGRALVDRFGKYLLLSHRDLDRAQAWFDRRGEPTVLLARVVPVARTFVSLPAGVAEMEPVRFGLYSVVGIAVWVSALSAAGYALGNSWNSMVKGFGDAGYAAAAIIGLALVAAFVHRVRVVREERAQAATAPAQRGSSSAVSD